MRVNTFVEGLKNYLNSLGYLITVAALAFFAWVLPGDYTWIACSLYILLGFLPLLAPDGRSYFPLFLGSMLLSSEDVSFNSLPVNSMVVFGFLLVSLFIYIGVHQPHMRVTSTFICLIIMASVLFFSYIYNAVAAGQGKSGGILYLLCLILFIVVYLLLASVIGTEQTLPYYASGIGCLAITIALEVYIRSALSGFGLVSETFSLGWSYTPETASTLLTLSLPFFAMLVYDKQPFWLFPFAFVFAAILLLSTDSGLLTVILFFIPMTILTFRKSGRLAPYFILFLCVGVFGLVGILMTTNADFSARILSAIRNLNVFPGSTSERKSIYDEALANFVTNPVIGSSIISFVNENGTLTFASNTLLSTAVMGGSLGVAALVLTEASVYITFARKKIPEKWIFFLFLLSAEFIGLIDNTYYNLVVALFLLLSFACFEMTSRPEDVRVHQDYFEDYPMETRPY